MDRDLKGIIDSVDTKNKTQSVLERKIESLKEEIARLNYTIQEQKNLISTLKSSSSESGLEVDDDIKFLKDMIFTQRQEILEKDREVDDLKLEIDKYIVRLEKEGISDDEDKLKEALKEADRRIEQLNNTIEQYQSNDENAQEIIKQMTREKEASYNEIKMLKRKVTDLEAKDFTYIESVDLKNAKEQIEELEGERQNLQGEIVDLQQELEDTSKQLLEKLERAEQLKIEN
jgi:chromosome segregation ATPase